MDTLLGLNIGVESVEVVEVRRNSGALDIRAIGEWMQAGETDFPALGDRLRSFVQANAVQARNAAVALDGRLLIVQTFPVETGLSRAEWERHAAWERSQYFPSVPAEEFVGDLFPLPPHPQNTTQEIMSVALRREDIRTLRKMVHHAGLELAGVDGAHFCAETLLLERSQELTDLPALFVGMNKERIEWSLYERRALVDYGARQVHGTAAAAEALRAVLQDRRPEQVLLHGSGAGQETQAALRDALRTQVRAFDPFRTVGLPGTVPLAEHFASSSFRFAAAVGAALRAAGED